MNDHVHPIFRAIVNGFCGRDRIEVGRKPAADDRLLADIARADASVRPDPYDGGCAADCTRPSSPVPFGGLCPLCGERMDFQAAEKADPANCVYPHADQWYCSPCNYLHESF